MKIGGIIILVILVVGLLFWYQNSQSATPPATTPPATTPSPAPGGNAKSTPTPAGSSAAPGVVPDPALQTIITGTWQTDQPFWLQNIPFATLQNDMIAGNPPANGVTDPAAYTWPLAAYQAWNNLWNKATGIGMPPLPTPYAGKLA